MLDLGLVRDNLPKIEEMLRHRGMNPDVVLKDFRTVDAQRRQAITSAETLKAERNRLTEQIAGMKKSGQDASQVIAETKNMRVQIQEMEAAAQEYDTRLSEAVANIPNTPHESGPAGKGSERKAEIRRCGAPPKCHYTPKPR